MTFREQLVKLRACSEAKDWVGDKSTEEAWKTCENPQWMLWILTKTELDIIDPLCDIAEGVLHLVQKDSQLSCIAAISAARRRANKDELKAARDAADDASAAASGAWHGLRRNHKHSGHGHRERWRPLRQPGL
jgi:hypothetical protein